MRQTTRKVETSQADANATHCISGLLPRQKSSIDMAEEGSLRSLRARLSAVLSSGGPLRFLLSRVEPLLLAGLTRLQESKEISVNCQYLAHP